MSETKSKAERFQSFSLVVQKSAPVPQINPVLRHDTGKIRKNSEGQLYFIRTSAGLSS